MKTFVHTTKYLRQVKPFDSELQLKFCLGICVVLKTIINRPSGNHNYLCQIADHVKNGLSIQSCSSKI